MLQHIALTINDSEEIENFYENILLFSLKYKFSVNGEIVREIFNTEEIVDVYMMGHHDTRLEIFLSPKKEKKVFSHICLAYWKAEIAYNKAIKYGYKALVKNNPKSNTYFIWDKSGNMFEIKEIVEQ
ncbi:MAG: VOC family protein [Bacteroidales bacterium]